MPSTAAAAPTKKKTETENKKREKNDVIASLDADQLQRALASFKKWSSRLQLDKGPMQKCKKTRKVPNTSGYAQCSKTGATLHQVAYFAAKTNNFKDKVELKDNYQVSHLCDERCCLNEQHLVYEDCQTNQSRKGCAAIAECSTCGLSVSGLCNHNPKCEKKKMGTCNNCKK
jgi:hypothetical protein